MQKRLLYAFFKLSNMYNFAIVLVFFHIFIVLFCAKQIDLLYLLTTIRDLREKDSGRGVFL